MSVLPSDSEAKTEPKTQVSRLVKRATRERWRIPRNLRGPLVGRLNLIAQDCKAGSSGSVAAARGLLSASKLNLDNISATIKADDHTDLERRMTELEQIVEQRKSEPSW
jgi:hypothetical protein